jgi:signal transduction histidine kinase/CheY-like chemotaxis protein/AraC-like DNA-binding protein/streptogramin lyase
MKLRKFAFYLFFLLWFGSFAQSELDFVKYSTADGLPSNRVGHICADPEGFVWAATSNGLARFDGQRFVQFDGLLPDIQSQYAGKVRLMFPDNRGFLWVLVFGDGIYRIDLSTLKSKGFKQDFLNMPGMMFPAASEDAKGNLWISAIGGLARYIPKKELFELHPFPDPKVWVHTFCKLADGNLFVATDKGFFEFNVSSFEWTFHSKLWNNGSHISLIPDEDGTVWIGDWYLERGGFRHYDVKKKRNLRLFSALPSHPDSIPSTDFQGFFIDGDRIWLATNDQGLVVFDKKTERFRRFQPDANNPQSFSAMQSHSVAKDKFGNLWVGTAQFLNFANVQPKFVTHIGYKDGLISNECMNAEVVSPGKVVFGTLSGLSIYDRSLRTCRNVSLPLFNQNGYNNQVVAIAPCDATSFWVNTWSSLSRIDLNTGKVLEYFITNVNAGEDHPPARLHPDIGTSMHIKTDSQGNLWLTAKGRLIKYSHREPLRQFTIFDTLIMDDIRGNDLVTCIWAENEKRLLLGTHDGFARFDIASGKAELLPFQFPFENRPVQVDFLEKSNSGGYLAIVNQRLFRLDPDHPEKLPVEIDIPFPNFSPNGLIEDDQHAIWVSGEMGVVRLGLDGKTNTLYEPKHYLNNNFFSPDKRQIAKDADGNLYFPGSAGVSVIQPGTISTNTSPTVRIVSLLVNNELFPLDTAIYHSHQIRLAHDQNNLLFGFSVFNSAVPALNRFAYRLDGVASQWMELNTQNTLNLAKLRPGKYTLHLRGANSDGVWAEIASPLHIVIRPPWWASWWAYLLYTVSLAAAGWWFYRFRLRQQLAQQEALRLRELDEFKSRFFTNITHEFRTPLTVILGMASLPPAPSKGGGDGTAYVMSSPPLEEAGGRLALIRRNAENLLRLINQILDLAKLESNSLRMNYIQGDVLPYLRYIAESLHSFANAQNVMLRVESYPNSYRDKIVMDYDPERLLQIVHNLLSNAIKFTPSGGRVTLKVGMRNEESGMIGHGAVSFPIPHSSSLILTISDTGVGIPPEDLPKIFDRFYQVENQAPPSGGRGVAGGTGIGLSLTKELVKAMGGDISVESEVGKGTTFTVRLPISNVGATLAVAHPVAVVLSGEILTAASPQSGRPQGSPLPTDGVELPSILLIEDNPDVVEYLTACLGGFALDFAYNGRAGIEKALETVPDLIISDVMMPEKDGFEVCNFLKNDERTSHIPIILLTAKADVESRIAGLKRGADAYLAKPFHQEELMVTLQNLLEVRRKLQLKYAGLQLAAGNGSNASPPSLISSRQIGTDYPSSLEDVFLQKVRSLVEEHLSDAGFSVDDLARKLGMSYSVVNRKLTALTGRSTTLFMRDIRLQHAMKMLSEDKLTVSEVAYAAGFNDPKFFSRVFTEAYGKPPSAFLEK